MRTKQFHAITQEVGIRHQQKKQTLPVNTIKMHTQILQEQQMLIEQHQKMQQMQQMQLQHQQLKIQQNQQEEQFLKLQQRLQQQQISVPLEAKENSGVRNQQKSLIGETGSSNPNQQVRIISPMGELNYNRNGNEDLNAYEQIQFKNEAGCLENEKYIGFNQAVANCQTESEFQSLQRHIQAVIEKQQLLQTLSKGKQNLQNVKFTRKEQQKKQSDIQNQTQAILLHQSPLNSEADERDEDYVYYGASEIASIYQTNEERELNRPRRQAVPNPDLEFDMQRYRLKIERKFAESAVNSKFKMPLFDAKKNRRVANINKLSQNIISQRCSSQVQQNSKSSIQSSIMPANLTIQANQSGQRVHASLQRFTRNELSLDKQMNSQTRMQTKHTNQPVQFEDYGQLNNLTILRNYAKCKDTTQPASLREAMSQQPQIFALNTVSNKTMGTSGREINNSSFQFNDNSMKQILMMENRQPSAKSRQAAMKAKSKIYTKRNLVDNIATSTSSTKNCSLQRQPPKQITSSITREQNTSLTNSSVKPHKIILSPDDNFRRQKAYNPFISTQNIPGLSNFSYEPAMQLHVPTLSTKNITSKINGSRGQRIEHQLTAQLNVGSKQGDQSRTRKLNRISEKDILLNNEMGYKVQKMNDPISLIQSNGTSNQQTQRTNQQFMNNSTQQIQVDKSKTKNAFELKQILKMNAHHQKMNSQRSSAISNYQQQAARIQQGVKMPVKPQHMLEITNISSQLQKNLHAINSSNVNQTIVDTSQGSLVANQNVTSDRRAKSTMRATSQLANTTNQSQKPPASMANIQKARGQDQPGMVAISTKHLQGTNMQINNFIMPNSQINQSGVDIQKINRKFLLPQLNLNLNNNGVRSDLQGAAPSTTAAGIQKIVQQPNSQHAQTAKSSNLNTTTRKVVASHKLIPKNTSIGNSNSKNNYQF